MLTVSPKTQKFLLKELHQRHRYYHTYSHVCHILESIQEYKDKLSNVQAAELAAHFHDVVYEVGDAYDHNEVNSCRVFLEKIEEDNPNISVDNETDPDFRTVQLTLIMIGCTFGHTLERLRNSVVLTEEELEDVKMFLDFDLRILAETEERLLDFENGIRKEFSIYDDEIYRHGRTKVLQSFLNRRQLFFSEVGKNWEEKARQNLQFLIDRLK